MTLYDYTEYKNLVVCGDIHGEFSTLAYNVKRLGIENSVIIVAGDCGVGFEKETHYPQLYGKLRKSFDKSNNLLLLVRGNHDDPAYFDGAKIDFERMKCIPDYSVVKAAGRNVLCVGGATSIDRKHRLKAMWLEEVWRRRPVRRTYWENEAPVFYEFALTEIAASGIEIDCVVTHTRPSFCYPHSKKGIEGWLAEDDTLAADLDNERAVMDRLHERLHADGHPVRDWFYAHFHDSRTEFIGDIRFSLLGIMELKQA